MSARSAERVEAARRAVALSVVVSCRLLRFPKDLNAAPTVEIAGLSRTSLAPSPRPRANGATRIDALRETSSFVSGWTHRMPSTKSATVKRNESTTLRGPPRASVARNRQNAGVRAPPQRGIALAPHAHAPSLATGGRSSARRVARAFGKNQKEATKPKSRAVAIWTGGRG
jgi:hypothetical protein